MQREKHCAAPHHPSLQTLAGEPILAPSADVQVSSLALSARARFVGLCFRPLPGDSSCSNKSSAAPQLPEDIATGA